MNGKEERQSSDSLFSSTQLFHITESLHRRHGVELHTALERFFGVIQTQVGFASQRVLATLCHISVNGLEGIINMVERFHEPFRSFVLDLFKLVLRLSSLVFGFVKASAAVLEFLGHTVKRFMSLHVRHHAFNFGFERGSFFIEILSNLLLFAVAKTLLQIFLHSRKVNLGDFVGIPDNLGVVLLRELGSTHTILGFRLSLESARLLGFFFILVHLFVTVVSDALAGSSTSTSAFVVTNHRKMYFFDTSLLERFMQLSSKSFQSCLLRSHSLTNPSSVSLEFLEVFLKFLDLRLQLLFFRACLFNLEFRFFKLFLGLLDLFFKVLDSLLGSLELGLVVFDSLLKLDNGSLEVAVGLVVLLLLQMRNVFNQSTALLVVLIATFPSSRFVCLEILETSCFTERSKMGILGCLDVGNGLFARCIESLDFLFCFGELFLGFWEISLDPFEQRFLFVERLTSEFHIGSRIVSLVLESLVVIAKLFNSRGMAHRLATRSTCAVQVGPFSLQSLLFFSELIEFLILEASSSIAILFGDTSGHSSRLGDDSPANCHGLDTWLVLSTSTSTSVVSKAQLTGAIQVITDHSGIECIQDCLFHGLVASDHVNRQFVTSFI